MAKPHFTEIFVLWPVMNKLYDEIHKNVLMGYFAVLTSTLNMLERLETEVSQGLTTAKQHHLDESEVALRD